MHIICRLVYKVNSKDYFDVGTGEQIQFTKSIPVNDNLYYFVTMVPNGDKYHWLKVKSVRRCDISPELKELIGET